MAFKDQINQNVGFFIYNREFLFFSGIIGSPQAFNRFQIIPGDKCGMGKKVLRPMIKLILL